MTVGPFQERADAAALERLKDVERAVVLKKGRPAATLTRTEDGIEFVYDEAWLDERNPPVATTLPLTADPVRTPGGSLPAYFAGLLPEGRRLGALRRAVKTSADDELSLLLAVGADAIGDVAVVPAGDDWAATAPALEVDDFAEVSFAEILAGLGVRVDRVGLPGVQDKVSAAMLNLPVRQRRHRFLLKLDPPEFAHLVANEAFFLAAVRATGLPAVDARLVEDAEGRQGLLVTRFDRPGPDPADWLGVEDGCQRLGLPPADKYRTGADRAMAALVGVCEAPAVAARALLMQLAFAYVTGNGDAHAKNFSVLQDAAGEWRAAPAYDVPSSQPYGDSTMALSIGGRSRGDFGLADFAALGARLGLTDRAARAAVAQVADAVDEWLPGLADLPFDRGQVAKLRRVIEHRRGRLRGGKT